MKHKVYMTFFFILGFSIYIKSQCVFVENTVTDFLWADIENPLLVSFSGDCDNLVLKSSNGTIKKRNDCSYTIKPLLLGKAEIYIYKTTNNDTIKLSQKSFKVKMFPKPITTCAGKESGKIKKNILIAQSRLNSDVINFDIDIHYPIISYEVIIIKDSIMILNKNIQGDKLTQDVIDKMKLLNSGDIVFFYNIIVYDLQKRKIPSGQINLEIE